MRSENLGCYKLVRTELTHNPCNPETKQKNTGDVQYCMCTQSSVLRAPQRFSRCVGAQGSPGHVRSFRRSPKPDDQGGVKRQTSGQECECTLSFWRREEKGEKRKRACETRVADTIKPKATNGASCLKVWISTLIPPPHLIPCSSAVFGTARDL